MCGLLTDLAISICTFSFPGSLAPGYLAFQIPGGCLLYLEVLPTPLALRLPNLASSLGLWENPGLCGLFSFLPVEIKITPPD